MSARKEIGSFADTAPADLLRNVERGGATGELRVSTSIGRGTVWFRDGHLVDAELGDARADAAVIRLLGVSSGTYEFFEGPVARQAAIEESVDAVVARRDRRAAAWQRLVQRIPSLDSVLVRASSSPSDARIAGADRELLELVDGRRTLVELIDQSGFDAVAVLERVAAFLDQGLVRVSQSEHGEARHDANAAPVTRRLYSLARDLLGHDPELAAPPASERGAKQNPPRPAEPAAPPRPAGRAPETHRSGVAGTGKRTPTETASSVRQPAHPSHAPARSDAFVPGYDWCEDLSATDVTTVHLCREQGGERKLAVVEIQRRELASLKQVQEAFRREAELATRVVHPNLVRVVETGEHEGRPYFVREHFEGLCFGELLERAQGRLPPSLVVPAMLDALAGLHAVHALAGFHGAPAASTHAGVSLQTLSIGADGTGRLTGFGYVRVLAAVPGGLPEVALHAAAFVAPEQARGEPVDARADLFAAGAVLWTMLTGLPLFAARSASAAMQNVLERPIPLPSTVGARPPRIFDPVVVRAVARDPAERFQRAEEMLRVLRTISAQAGILSPPAERAKLVRALLEQPADRPPGHGGYHLSALAVEPAPSSQPRLRTSDRPVSRSVPPERSARSRWSRIGVAVVLVAAGVAIWIGRSTANRRLGSPVGAPPAIPSAEPRRSHVESVLPAAGRSGARANDPRAQGSADAAVGR